MAHDPLDLSGQTAIVTGGTKGLGRVIAERLLDHGADVVICARNEPTEPVTTGERTAHFVAADVRDPEQIAGVVSATLDENLLLFYLTMMAVSFQDQMKQKL